MAPPGCREWRLQGVGSGASRVSGVAPSESVGRLHPEDPVLGVRYGRVEGGAQRHAQDPSRVGRVDHSVVPEAGAGVVGRPLVLKPGDDRILDRIFLLR